MIERALGGALTHHLGYPPGGSKPEDATNHRNGSGSKTVTDDKILALYARRMTVREIQAFSAEMYAVEVSPDLISTVTDAVVASVTAWQTRPLEPMNPVVFFEALRSRFATKRPCGATPSISPWPYCQDILIAATNGLKGISEALAAVFPRRRC
jgi:putative transposase